MKPFPDKTQNINDKASSASGGFFEQGRKVTITLNKATLSDLEIKNAKECICKGLHIKMDASAKAILDAYYLLAINKRTPEINQAFNTLNAGKFFDVSNTTKPTK